MQAARVVPSPPPRRRRTAMTRPPAQRSVPDTAAILRAVEAGHESTRRDNEALRELVTLRLDGMSTRMERVERDLAKGEINAAGLRTEMGEIRLALGETRDLVNQRSGDIMTSQSQSVTTAAATGAAQGSAQGATQALSGQKGILTGIGLLSVMTMLMTFLAFGKAILGAFLALIGLGDAVGD